MEGSPFRRAPTLVGERSPIACHFGYSLLTKPQTQDIIISVDVIYAMILEEECGWINGLKWAINYLF